MKAAGPFQKSSYPAAIPAGLMAVAWSAAALGLEMDGGLSWDGPAIRFPGQMRDFAPSSEGLAGSDWGIAARYHSKALKTQFNFYWAESQEGPVRAPSGTAETGLPPGAPPIGDDYALAYPESARRLGAGFQTTVRQASLGSDIQVSRNASLASAAPDSATAAGADPPDKLNRIASSIVRVRLSAAYAVPSTSLWDSATVRLNVGRQRLNSMTRNAVTVDPGANRHTRSIQFLFTPVWSEVLPNLDLSLPVSLSYSPKAQAPLPGVEGAYKGGQFSVGASAVYQKVWNTDLRYMHYLGEPASTSPLKDRNFLWLSIQRSF